MIFKTINPANGQPIGEFSEYSLEKTKSMINSSQDAFDLWKESSFSTRSQLLQSIATSLRTNRDTLAAIITKEVGKRISESQAEVEKCALVCDYYATNSENFLSPISVLTEAKSSQVIYEPLGIILAIMPWNFPFWQVFRCAAPAIMAGNSLLLKHASNVPESALAIEKIFTTAGAPAHLFQTLLISSSQTPEVISDPRVRLVSLTGSEDAGSSVAALAGKSLKKTILELGGSDPFIVLKDADIDKAASTAASSRLIVSGQSCIAAKRFFVDISIYDQFLKKFKEVLLSKKVGDPTDPTTEVGPLSSLSILETVDDQVKRSVAMGAKIEVGGQRLNIPGFYYPPTLLTNISQNMPVFTEETFGPIAIVVPFSDIDSAISMANNSHFGLGASVWTRDKEVANTFIKQLSVGAVFVNSMVKSDPRLPFGGTKFSGYGRELSEFGLREFTNIKSVWSEINL